MFDAKAWLRDRGNVLSRSCKVEVGNVVIRMDYHPSQRAIARLADVLPILYPDGARLHLSRRQVAALLRGEKQ